MDDEAKVLAMRFDGTVPDRNEFLGRVRFAVTELTGETMTLDALIVEIVKNIFDHARGMGSLVIEFRDGSFEFEIKDDGEESYDFESCSACSGLAGNGVNFGIGLKMIRDLAESLGIVLRVSASRGFSYSGSYVPQKSVR